MDDTPEGIVGFVPPTAGSSQPHEPQHGQAPKRPLAPGRGAAADFLSSWLAYCSSLVVSHPIDTVRVRWLLGQRPMDTFRQDTIRSLYAGMATPVVTNGPIVALVFTVNEGVKSALVARRCGEIGGSAPGDHATLGETAIAGGVAGFGASILQCPATLLRIQQQNSARGRTVEGGAPAALPASTVARRVVAAHGVRGLWRAWPYEAVAGTTGRLSYFWLYEWCKRMFAASPLAAHRGSADAAKAHAVVDSSEYPLRVRVAAAAATSVGSWTVVYPVDSIKTKLQGDALDPTRRRYRSFAHCCRVTWRLEGWRGFWTGFSLTVARSAVVSSIQLPGFDYMKPRLRSAAARAS